MVLAKPTTDIWHVGIIPSPIAHVLEAPRLEEVVWLPQPGHFRFIADPFGLWHEGQLWVFVEALDYRIKRGEIHYYGLNADFSVHTHGVALRAPYHLSYPYMLMHQGQPFMLPEAHRSGRLTLYQAQRFPDQWRPVATLLELPAIDASIVEYNGLWWMFFALPGGNQRALNELYVAYADTLTGPWHVHPQNPVRTGLEASRPGGTPFVAGDALYLPMQDCRHDYGGAMTVLRVDVLTPSRVETSVVVNVSPTHFPAPYGDGVHTLAQAGPVTLVDGKQILRSHHRRLINLTRKLRRVSF